MCGRKAFAFLKAATLLPKVEPVSKRQTFESCEFWKLKGPQTLVVHNMKYY